MYAKNLKIHKGVTNKLQFQFLNQEQKNVNFTLFTNPTVIFRLISATGEVELLKKQVSSVFPANGLMEVILTDNEVAELAPEKLFYSLELVSSGFSSPVFIDANAAGRGTVTVEESIMPKVVATQMVNIPSFPILNPSNPSTYYSDSFETDGRPFSWIQAKLNQFSGSIQLEGTTSTLSNVWYEIDVPTDFFTSTTETIGVPVEGFHPYIRLKMTSGQGSLDKILVR